MSIVWHGKSRRPLLAGVGLPRLTARGCPPGCSALDSAPAAPPLSNAILNRLSAFAPMIEVSALTKCYGEFTAVRDLSFAVQPG